MPQLGETVTEGTVTTWLRSEGDVIAVDEPLLEVSTDKVETEIPSAFAGVLQRIVVGEGETVPIGALLAVIGDGDDEESEESEDEPVTSHVDHAPRESARAGRVAMEGGEGYLQTPVVRTTMRRHAPRERQRGHEPAPARSEAPAAPAPANLMDVARREPFSAIRRRTAENLTSSLRTAAHTATVVEVDYGAVDETRERVSSRFKARHGHGLSYLPFITRAVCEALARFERLNASTDGESLAIHSHVNVGVAVDLDFEGLIVPVVHHAETMRLEALADRMHDLADRARSHQLTGDDVAGGTFTITNAGAFGTALTVPIINPPQVAILSTDGVRHKPVAVRGPNGEWTVAVRPVGNLSLSFDHRANDGAYASAFLDAVRTEIETRDWSAEITAP
jgi:2-oxoglutarate dehydrogenase E2 component (dihydrolipoamide succinyltransferase)